MLDPFADALGDDIHSDFVSTGSDVALSPDGNTVQIVIDCEEPDLDKIEEAAMQGVESSAEEPTLLESSAQGRAKPKVAPQPKKRGLLAAQQKNSRRKMDPTLQLKLTPVQAANGSDIRCIFVPQKKDGLEAIPLWPQFKADWRGARLGETTWLSVSTQSRWVYLMVNAITPKCVRDVCQHMFVAARSEFSACVTRARSQTKSVIQDESQNVDSDSDSDADMQHVHKDAAALNVDIGGYTVKCINTKRQILISVDDASVKFIRHWLLPLAQKSVLSAVEKKSPLAVAKPLTEAVVGFQFSANPMPNLSGKVTWNPANHAWRVKANKPCMKIEGSFEVDKFLSADAYHKVKSLEYRKAVDAWNKCDGSKRHRIKVATVLLEDHGETSEHLLEETSGSQPSSEDG